MTSEQLKQFKENLQRANDSLTKKDFEVAFSALTAFVKKLQVTLTEKNDQAVQELTTLVNKLGDKLEVYSQQKLLSAQVKIDKALHDQEVGMNYLRDWSRKVVEGKQGEPGISPDPQEIAQLSAKIATTEVLNQIPSLDAISSEISKKGDLIASALEALDDGSKLKIQAIEGLEKILEELRQLRSRTLGGVGGFSLSDMTQHFINDEIPTDSGNHLTFTINHTPVNGTFKLYRSRARQNLTEDYTISGKTLTLTVAFDSSSESLYCEYIR